MVPLELDERYTFDAFIVGAGNPLAAAAARRVAESPGQTYNPLFVYSSSGLGKTHLLMAIGNEARRYHDGLEPRYDTLERFLDEVIAAIETGKRDDFQTRLSHTGMLLLDDVQFLAGRHRSQEELLRVWDLISARGGQIVMASDRPPMEIDGLDDRLLSRFSGGLIVDIGAPDYETRVAILLRKAEERGAELAQPIAEAIARAVSGNVRELQGALNRLLALQELEDRAVAARDVPRLLGRSAAQEVVAASEPTGDEFRDFLDDISGTMTTLLAESPAERRYAEAIAQWSAAGFSTTRLAAALADPATFDGAEALVAQFEADIERLRAIAAEIDSLEPGADVLRSEVFRDPDALAAAEAEIEQVRERAWPLPEPAARPTFETLALPAEHFATRAARAVAEKPAIRYNPFFLHGADRALATAMLTAIGNGIRAATPDAPVAMVRGSSFAAELIQALEKNRVDVWRARYRKARTLIVDAVDALEETDRAQEELFHLFEELHRAGAQLVFSADRPPSDLTGVDERLRSRLGSGLVAELPTGLVAEPVAPPPLPAAVPPGPLRPRQETAGLALVKDEWFLSPEKVIWDWPYPGDLLVESLD